MLCTRFNKRFDLLRVQSRDPLLKSGLSAAVARIRPFTRAACGGDAPLYVWHYGLHVPIDDVIDNVVF